MSDDINLNGVILTPTSSTHDRIRWTAYGLLIVGTLSGLAMLALGSSVWGSAALGISRFAVLVMVALGLLLLALAWLLARLHEIRVANHTIVD